MIISQGPLAGQNLLEAISATLVMATFGLNVKVCFKNEALLLLNPPSDIQQPSNYQQLPSYFKSAYAMVESFEFYDLFPILVETKSSGDLKLLDTSQLEYELVSIDHALLNQFDQVIYW